MKMYVRLKCLAGHCLVIDVYSGGIVFNVVCVFNFRTMQLVLQVLATQIQHRGAEVEHLPLKQMEIINAEKND